MKQTLPSLFWVALFVIALGSGAWWVVDQRASRAASTILPPEFAPVVPSLEGQQIVATTARELHRLPSLELKVRFAAKLEGEELKGTGNYWQLGSGEEKLLRLDLSVAAEGNNVFEQQICDQQHFWLRRSLPMEEPTLERIELRTLRLAISKAGETSPATITNSWLMLGGLPRLFAELDRAYEFAAPKNVPVQGGTLVVLRGRIRPSWLQSLTGSETLRDQPLGEQVPLEVELTLSQNQQGPSYFPYQIDFFRAPSRAEQQAQAELHSQTLPKNAATKPTYLVLPLLLSLEFLPAPRHGELDPRFFDFDPGDADFDDGTQQCLKRLGLVK